jgi:Metallo-peptidase family M12
MLLRLLYVYLAVAVLSVSNAVADSARLKKHRQFVLSETSLSVIRNILKSPYGDLYDSALSRPPMLSPLRGRLPRLGRFELEVTAYEERQLTRDTELHWRGLLYTPLLGDRPAEVAGTFRKAPDDTVEVVFSFQATSRNGVLHYYSARYRELETSFQVTHAPEYLLTGATCGLNKAVRRHVRRRRKEAQSKGQLVRAQGILPKLDLAVEADPEWVSVYGSAAQSTVSSLVHRANVFYQRDLGLSLNLKGETFRKNPSPYGAFLTRAELLLFTYAGVSLFTPGVSSNDLGILLTGRDLDDKAIGVAFTGVVCRMPFLSRGVVQHVNDAVDHVIFAHEIGHILGAEHTEEGIMTTSLGTPSPDRFSEVSQSQIETYLSKNGGCLSSD